MQGKTKQNGVSEKKGTKPTVAERGEHVHCCSLLILCIGWGCGGGSGGGRGVVVVVVVVIVVFGVLKRLKEKEKKMYSPRLREEKNFFSLHLCVVCLKRSSKGKRNSFLYHGTKVEKNNLCSSL